MEKIVNSDDLQTIRDRDPEVDFKRLYLGCGRLLHRKFNWEDKYRLKFSIPAKPEEIVFAASVGMIPKSELKDSSYYWGICRNARVARWSQRLQKFEYSWVEPFRIEVISHPEDEDVIEIFGKKIGFDVFIPFYSIEPKGFEVIEQIS